MSDLSTKFADAILDRIAHNAYRLELDGESLRKRQAPSPKINPA
jgi:DNA replication protein DnaC